MPPLQHTPSLQLHIHTHHTVTTGFVDRRHRSDDAAGQMERYTGWWTKIVMIGQTRVKGVGRYNNQMSGWNIVDMVYLDFAKAFHKVIHGVLLNKIKTLGITGKMGVWLYHFLTHRTHFVRLQGGISHDSPVPSSVPQSTVLGPLLFIILIVKIIVILMGDMVPTTPACTWWNRTEEHLSSAKLESTHPSRTVVKSIKFFYGFESVVRGNTNSLLNWAADHRTRLRPTTSAVSPSRCTRPRTFKIPLLGLLQKRYYPRYQLPVYKMFALGTFKMFWSSKCCGLS